MSLSSIDALIVGAGPVGLTMAAALTHQGLSYRIIDKAPQASDKSKALVLWSRSLELFQPLGLARTFVETGAKATGGSIYSDHKRIVHFELTGDESPFGFPLMIPQNKTEHILTEHLASRGVTVERPVELISFTETADVVVSQLRYADGHEEFVDTPWLLGCDGAHSAVRHLSGIPFTGHAEPNDWILADIRIEGPLEPDEISIFWHRTGILAVFPFDRGRFRVIADLGKADPSTRPTDPTLADVQAKVDERGPGGLTLVDPVWLSNFRINERKVAEYRRGRITLAGDAAHIHSPAGGQGMNTGMQDAFNLAWKLGLVQRGQGQAEPLLNSYSVERSGIGDQVLKAAGAFTTVATLRNPIAQSLRNHIAPLLTSFQFVQDKIRRQFWEISLNYRHSPLSDQDWPAMTAELLSGDRLPDAPLTSFADNCPTTLLETLDGRHLTLLLLGGNDADSLPNLIQIADEACRAFPDSISTHVIVKSEAASTETLSSSVSAWIDTESRVHERLHAVSPALILVRPDGYLAYRCQPAASRALQTYLRRFLKPETVVATRR